MLNRKTLLTRILALILLTVLLTAALTGIVFNYSGKLVFSNIKVKELQPRAKYLSSVTAEYMQGFMNYAEYRRAIGSGYHVWDAAMYAYDAAGRQFAYPARSDNEQNTLAISAYVDNVLAGESVYSPNTKNKAGVIIGEPVKSRMGNIIGAVFLVKPLGELNAAMGSLLVALVISLVAVSFIMIFPAYWGTKGITEPISQMCSTANAMAGGDFSVRAGEDGIDEIAQLGRSLNSLSAALYATINDLILEKNRLHAVINGLGEGIIAVDAQGKIIKTNDAAAKLLGGNGEEVEELESYQACKSEIYRVLSGERAGQMNLTVNDRILRVISTSLTETDESKRIEGAVLLIQDVTEAERLEKTRREYVANVSHELRTPIASIRGLADALNDGLVKKEEDKARYYGYILRESMRLSRLIDDLLELSRLQSGTISITKQKVSINELVLDVAERFAVSAKEQGMTITACVHSERALAFTNPDRAEQVLVTLVDNALKHGEANGAIVIQTVESDNEINISVSNPGSIAPEDEEHIFERFYKADKAHSGSGTGLGLSIVKEIMELMHERVWVKNENGVVTFTFTLDSFDTN